MALPAAAQRVCPHCSTLSTTAADRCPICQHGFVRHPIRNLLVGLLLSTLITLAAIVGMFLYVANRIENEIDARVSEVQQQVNRSISGVESSITDSVDKQLDGLRNLIPSLPFG